MDLANTFKGQKSAVILYSQCDATVRSQQRHPILKNRKSNPNEKPKTKSNPNPTLIQIQKKNQIQIQSKRKTENQILSKRKTKSKSNPIQKTTGIQLYETVNHNILPENIALLLRGIFFELLPYDRD
jgi:hypothetical protein